jgi:SNF2 family DNA or RNA helicase
MLVEEQAIDRVHRIGQTKPVSVTRFIIKNTVEDKMLHLQSRKRQLAKAALSLSKDQQVQERLDELVSLFAD